MKTELDARGNLVLTLETADEREDLAETTAYYKREGMVNEMLRERYSFVTPESIGALTSAPILADYEGLVPDEYGDSVPGPESKIYWFPNYQVEDPWETLTTTGSVTFTAAPPLEAK